VYSEDIDNQVQLRVFFCIQKGVQKEKKEERKSQVRSEVVVADEPVALRVLAIINILGHPKGSPVLPVFGQVGRKGAEAIIT